MRRALAVVWRDKRVLALHLAANLVLFGLAWLWLSVPESRVWHLLLSTSLAGVIVLGALWLHGATMRLFRRTHQDGPAAVAESFRATRGRLPALLVWVAFSWSTFALITRLADLVPGVAEWTSSALTFLVRRPVPPAWMEMALAIPIVLLRWIGGPLLLLILGSAMSDQGFGALRGSALDRALGVARAPGLWLRFALLAAVGLGVPCLLVHWVPDLAGIPAQAASLTVRFLLAYSLLIASWLVLVALVGRAGRASEPPPIVASPAG